MTEHTTKLGASLSEVHSPRPAIARILVERGVNGSVHVTSTLEEAETSVQLLDEAMEALDGQRLPPETAA